MKKQILLLAASTAIAICGMAQQVTLAPRGAMHGAQIAKSPARIAEVRDENGIIVSPAAGEEKVFDRSGALIVPVGFSTTVRMQDGQVRMVYCDDGTVYLHHPLCCTLEESSKYGTPWNADTWIKGTRANGYISFPSQPVTYSNVFNCAIVIGMGRMGTSVSGAPAPSIDRDALIVFKEEANDKVLRLQNSSDDFVVGAFYDVDGDPCYYWEYDTTFALDTTNDHDPAVTLPAGFVPTNFIMTASTAEGMSCVYKAQIAVKGEEAYMSGFSAYAADCWIKGRRNEVTGNLTFASGQFLQTLDHYDMYFYALPSGSKTTECCDLVLTYDPAENRYVAGADIVVTNDRMTSSLNAAERLGYAAFRPFASDGDIIMDQPEGTLKTYKRYGRSAAPTGLGGVGFCKQEDWADAYINIVAAPDGKTIYMEEPIFMAYTGAWVKGTIEADGLAHFPLGQYVQKASAEGNEENYVTGVVKLVNEGTELNPAYSYEYTPEVLEVTFEIDEDGWFYLRPIAADDTILKLELGDGSYAELPTYMYAIVADTDFWWPGYGDAGSIYEPTDEVIETHVAIPAAGEKVNAYGIIVTPGDGKPTTYSRSGMNYCEKDGDAVAGEQEGVLHFVECENGTVYMQQPVSGYTTSYAATAWIRGKREGNLLYFAPSQPVTYHEYYTSNVSICMGQYVEGEGITADRRSFIVFEESEDGKTLTLQGSNNVTPLGAFFDDDNSWTGYGDYHTVLTFKSNGHVEETTEPNWMTEVQNYTLTATDLDEGGKGYNAVLAFEGNTVYLGNFCYWTDYQHEMNDKYIWIKGQKNDDGSLTFPKEQYLFTYDAGDKTYDLFFYGARENRGGYSINDLNFSYDATTDTYFCDGDILINWGRVSTSINRAEQLTNVVIRRDASNGTRPYIIKQQPEGRLLSYHRHGVAFGYDDYGQVGMCNQDSDIDIVFSTDGKYVYMHNPISEAIPADGGSWVSGTVDEQGNLHFPTMQWIDYNDEVLYGARTAALVLAGDDETMDYFMVPNIMEMSFTFDHATGSYSLDRLGGIDYDAAPAPRVIYGVVWSKDYTWAGYGDFDTVYTPNFKYNAINPVTVVRETETYYDFSGRRISRPAFRQPYIRNGKKIM